MITVTDARAGEKYALNFRAARPTNGTMKNVQELVQDRIEAGYVVMPKGRTTAVMTGAALGGVAGSAIKELGTMMVESTGAGASPLGNLSGKLGYLAVTAGEVVLLNARQGMVAPKATDVAARVDRSRVANVTLGDGTLSAPMTLTFIDGVTWEFEVGRAERKRAVEVVAALGGPGLGGRAAA